MDSSAIVYVNDDPGLTLTIVAKSNLVPYAFVWEKGKTMDFSETIVVYDLKLATDDRSDKKFLLTSKLCPPGGCMPPAPGLYTCIKSWKKMYKIRLQRDFFETCNKWVKWICLSVDIQILSPGGCLPLPRGYIHVLNHKTNCIKSDFKGIFLKLASNKWNDKTFLLTLKLCPLGAVCPCPGAIYMYKIMKKLHKIRHKRDFF